MCATLTIHGKNLPCSLYLPHLIVFIALIKTSCKNNKQDIEIYNPMFNKFSIEEDAEGEEGKEETVRKKNPFYSFFQTFMQRICILFIDIRMKVMSCFNL